MKPGKIWWLLKIHPWLPWNNTKFTKLLKWKGRFTNLEYNRNDQFFVHMKLNKFAYIYILNHLEIILKNNEKNTRKFPKKPGNIMEFFQSEKVGTLIISIVQPEFTNKSSQNNRGFSLLDSAQWSKQTIHFLHLYILSFSLHIRCCRWRLWWYLRGTSWPAWTTSFGPGKQSGNHSVKSKIKQEAKSAVITVLLACTH